METFRALLLALGAAGCAVASSGCAVPFAVWPTLPTDLGHTLQVRDAEGRPAAEGYVLLRVYEYNGAGLAEGDRNVRNRQVFDAAFETRSPTPVRVPEETVTKYRLDYVEVLKIAPDGTVQVPPILRPGTLWIVPGSVKAKEGVHQRTYFGEVQALEAGRPPSDRVEVTLASRELAFPSRLDPVAWRRELTAALEDVRRGAPDEFAAAESLEKELARLAALAPEAFVPDGVGPDEERTIPLTPSESDQGIPPALKMELTP